MVLTYECDVDMFTNDHHWCLSFCRIMPSLEDLHHAIRLRDKRKVKLLLSIPPINVNSSLRSCTALSLAVFQGEIDIVRMLLENGANANKLSRDWNDRIETPLFSACRLGHCEIARILINNGGADVTITDFYNHTPLWISTRGRRTELVALLIENGADLNLGDKWSQCPLYLATKYLGRNQIAKLLIQHGCKLDLTDMEGAHVSLKTRKYLIGRNLSIDIRINQPFYNWLQHELHNPPTLLRLAAKSVRSWLSELTMGKSIMNRVNALPISQEMKRLLIFQDFQVEVTID